MPVKAAHVVSNLVVGRPAQVGVGGVLGGSVSPLGHNILGSTHCLRKTERRVSGRKDCRYKCGRELCAGIIISVRTHT